VGACSRAETTIFSTVGSNPLPAIKKQSKSIGLLSFLERCFPLRARDVAFGSDVHYVSDVTPNGVVGKHYSLQTLGIMV